MTKILFGVEKNDKIENPSSVHVSRVAAACGTVWIIQKFPQGLVPVPNSCGWSCWDMLCPSSSKWRQEQIHNW